ncbi:MAG: hypothetical protein M3Q80_00365 [bacterium]|nr:hypothetical protein [bacterium]
MIGFHITVPGMKERELTLFVKEHIPRFEELMIAAKKEKLPNSCPHCNATLELLIRRFEKIPTEDLVLRIVPVVQMRKYKQPKMFQILQLASGHNTCREMKEGLSRIIHERILFELKQAKKRPEACII